MAPPRKRVEKICEVCGKMFTVIQTRANTAKACSQACRGGAVSLTTQAKRLHRECPACGTEFTIPPSHAARRKFCSTACANTHREYAGPTGDKVHNWKGGITTHSDGYLYRTVKGHPFQSGNYIFDHRLVVEERMRQEVPDHHFLVEVNGVKYLRTEIHVHHCDENKRNNDCGNLVACTKGAHQTIHAGRLPNKGDYWPEKPLDQLLLPNRVIH